jgi:hypothetical protein
VDWLGFQAFSSKNITYIYLIKPLTFLTNLLLNTGKFPDNLKISKIKPPFKEGTANDTKNYRPISLISTFSTILEKVVCIRLINSLDKHNIFLESQHSFCKGTCTCTSLVNFLEDMYKN